ncbi:glycosyltransferase family 2 protein [Flavobacterium sp. W22_SRS_FP1]|uniref:glycosyltransferase family 2 protein n=1 Tax=Flavobacterium sp. W22_SRS_FP1 TaxID=3240276 RepID=UPI003F8FC1AF
MKYDIAMITPFINSVYIYEFLKSLKNIKQVTICVILIDMLDEPIILRGHQYVQSSNVKFIHLKIGKRLSSSESRNAGLKYLFANIKEYSYVMFPDDDTTFNSSFCKEFLKLKKGNYILNVINKGTNESYAKYSKVNGTLMNRSDIDFVGCVRFLFLRELINQLGFFDERMGIGARYGAGEDGDYYLRALEFDSLYYNESLYTFHPAPTDKYSTMSLNCIVKRFSNYGKGAMFLFCKHKMYFKAIKMIVRGAGGSFFLLFKFQFKLSGAYFVAFLIRLKYLIMLSVKGVD